MKLRNPSAARFSHNGAPLVLLTMALFACRRSEIKGSLSLDGAKFDVEECRVGQLTLGQFKKPLHRFVLLDDGEGRELHFSDENSGKITVYYVAAPGKAPLQIGSECGTMSMEGDPAQTPATVRGTLEAACAAGGHTLNGKVEYTRCKAWNMMKPGAR